MENLILLSVLQGATEFLPVSSSAHLAIVNFFSQNINQSISVDLSLHVGSLLAMILYFYRNRITIPMQSYEESKDFLNRTTVLYLIILSAIPTLIIAYLLLNSGVINSIRDNINIIVWFNLIFAILLLISDLIGKKKVNIFKQKHIYPLALVQAIALVPGVSRSGICLTMSRFLGYGRTQSSIIAAIMSFPLLLVSLIYIIFTLFKEQQIDLTITILIAIGLSFLTSYITLKIIIEYIEKIKIYPFVIYRVCLSLTILYFIS
ncbi:MAG: undecaprenyl-diphosphate phosphatase [Hyphomicrobiales bacterium]|nr:undecaprenyl-diphosphate phosphatase [Hyphomicrobiales bacterium]